MDIEKRVLDYWTVRAHDFGIVRRNEIRDGVSARWGAELDSLLPGSGLRILDVGTGTGYFAVLLGAKGHDVIGIDLTPAIIDEAKALAGDLGVSAEFEVMDAQSLGFPDECFDAVVTRNLTWTLPAPERAYAEWLRVLKPGGLLLNYDANWYAHLYDAELRRAYEADRQATQEAGIKDEYVGTDIDAMEDIARQMPLSPVERPAWDEGVLHEFGATQIEVDPQVWERVFSPEERVNYASTPMFRVKARKAQ